MTNPPGTTVFFDIDTQLDFLFPAGALYVPGAEQLPGRLARLNRYAAEHGNVVISTVDAHTEDDAEFADWPPHCVAGTIGQNKPAATLLERRVVIPNARRESNVAGVQQILLEKQAFDCFTNVNLADTLAGLKAERYVVYGVITEICVKFAAMNLLDTGRKVELVTDAVCGANQSAASETIREFTARGGIVTNVDAVTNVNAGMGGHR